MKVYIVVGGFSGEDHEVDSPTIFGVFSKKADARKCFKETIKDYRPAEDEEGDEVKEDGYYECTNFDADEHCIIEIVEKEIE